MLTLYHHPLSANSQRVWIMLPATPHALGIVRMVQMLTVTALRSALTPLTYQMLGVKTYEPQQLAASRQAVETVLKFFEQLLGTAPSFGGEALTVADITASPSVLSCRYVDISLKPFPILEAWCERLLQRSAWQTTEPSAETISALRKSKGTAAFKQAQND